MNIFIPIIFILQGFIMVIDEFYFHHKRGLPRWERIGHPLDTFTVLLCFGYLTFAAEVNPTLYLGLAIFSCLFITKDEFVHHEKGSAGEAWLHSILFVLHPVILYCVYLAHAQPNLEYLFYGQFVLASVLMGYQIIYWNFFASSEGLENNPDRKINNEVYNTLGDRWYTAFDDPIALLRQESKVKVPWVTQKIEAHFGKATNIQVLDVGCGAGFLTNAMASPSISMTGIDLSEPSLQVARDHDSTGKVRYLSGDAYRLPFNDCSFDAVTCMDFLEHVDNPNAVISEISRILKPGGLFFYHTFNRNLISHLVIIKFVEWLVKNTPKNLHVIKLFIKPRELIGYCEQGAMKNIEITGIRPILSSINLSAILKRQVPRNFTFKLTKSLSLSYMGYAQKGAS